MQQKIKIESITTLPKVDCIKKQKIMTGIKIILETVRMFGILTNLFIAVSF